MGYWKQKLFAFFKKNSYRKFPVVRIVANVECELELDGETLLFSLPIVLSKSVKNDAKELLYGEIYDTLVHNLRTEKQEKKKHKRGTDKKELVLEPISDDSKGHQLLEKIGWIKGEGLGKDNDGIKEPLPIIIRKKRSGLGVDI